MAAQMSKKKKFVGDGVFFSGLNKILTREPAEDGYTGVEIRVTPATTQIIIRATRTQNDLGDKTKRIRELTSVIQKRIKFPENGVQLLLPGVSVLLPMPSPYATSSSVVLLSGVSWGRANTVEVSEPLIPTPNQPSMISSWKKPGDSG